VILVVVVAAAAADNVCCLIFCYSFMLQVQSHLNESVSWRH